LFVGGWVDLDMVRYISLLLFIGLTWGQDEYPYFSDMTKQLEFERKKIIIEEGENVQQIISGGGSEFNWWSLISEREPIYKNAPIKTSYRYHQYFDVKIDNRSISEIKMLEIMGLQDEADRILNDYKKQMMIYKQAHRDTTINADYIEGKVAKGCRNICGILTLGGIADGGDVEVLAMFVGVTYMWHHIYKKRKAELPYVIKTESKKPVIKQVLSPIQTKSLADAYNRKLYNDISKQ